MPYSNKKLNAPMMAPDTESKISAILFTCNPGRSPVAIPVITPITQKRINNNNSIIYPPLERRKCHEILCRHLRHNGRCIHQK